ncbi:MAG: 3-phosphoserine/phosphohydroxythreonine transaminase [Candidatus Cellulosilyticum pullistercoris]|uniref:Phosphoserine aminotransferase n=1 Tax=Candidatus Cellulosilyticum pullistercoris TaxID=2838521 RepID=A0A9E2KAU1_9FIRM|nr:3-phosphoserine/phosphohydroxythreonine transaminase [Candidatus Cellulosilyticum pullistercoris]
MRRVFNFSAGPGALPLEVLEKAQQELICYGDSGMSVMEMSHRSKDYDAIIKSAEAKLREVMGIPANYKVLFLQGGASLQFAMIPLNLLRKSFKADYIESGQFASKALKEAQKFGTINVVASSKADQYSYIPKVAKEDFDPEADYVYICDNNTIYGTKFHEYPDTGDVPLVADMSSCILSEPVDVSKFGIIYAGAQKNLGPAGVTLVIIREDLIGHAKENTPAMLDYKLMADNHSMYNTPPTYGIYMLKLMFEWIEAQGGVKELEKRNKAKAELLYNFLDQSKLFKGTARKEDRSMMNVTFVTGDPELDAKFVKEAAAEGLVSLKGHRSVGGMRASIYNAMPIEGVQKLVDFMRKFEAEN